MEISGRIHQGVVVVDGGLPWPEGTVVTVVYRGAPAMDTSTSRRPVRLPLVPSAHPGSRPLTSARVAELLDDEDDLRPEYDASVLKGGVRGKYLDRYRAGTNLAPLAPDIRAAFPTDEARQ